MNREIKREDIAAGLRQTGLTGGDTVLLHSSLSSLGRVQGGADAVVAAFLDVLGKDGTLVVPTFGNLGIITEKVAQNPEAVQSVHPLAKVAAIGRNATEICRDHWKAELAHGPGTPYMRIAELGGYVCLLGVDQDRNTTLHTVEEILRLPYLKTTAEKTFDTPEGTVTKSWPFFPGPHRDFIGLEKTLRDSGKMQLHRIGNATVRLIKSSDLISIVKAVGEKHPDFALCENPNCSDCVKQRAALRQDRFRRECFNFGFAATLAGRYPEEIADQANEAGIAEIEIDGLYGKPVTLLTENQLEHAIDIFERQQCRAVSLRLPCVVHDLERLCATVKRMGLPKLVLPLSHTAAQDIQKAQKYNVQLSFYNLAMDSPTVSGILLALREQGMNGNFTFSPANFAKAGEKPFLQSYKQKLRRFITQLYIEDCTFDGAPQMPGNGNAEIKEMISILRCANFSGSFILSGKNRTCCTLAESVLLFEKLINEA